jgi:hypothetical protein
MNKKHIIEIKVDGKLIKIKLPKLTPEEDRLARKKTNAKYYQKIRTSNITPELRKLKKLNRRIGTNLRTRLNSALKRNSKKGKTLELLGCSIEQLKDHLQKKFTEGMTWDNYGSGICGKGMKEWHIDHIIPCSSFILKEEEEQYRCFHYTNQQPMWAKENWDKHDKIDYILSV